VNTERSKNVIRYLGKPLPTSGQTPSLTRARSSPTPTSVRSHESIMAYYAHTTGCRRFPRAWWNSEPGSRKAVTQRTWCGRDRARACVSSSVLVFCFFHTFPSPVLSPPSNHYRVTHTHTHSSHALARILIVRVPNRFKVCVLRVRARVCACVCVCTCTWAGACVRIVRVRARVYVLCCPNGRK